MKKLFLLVFILIGAGASGAAADDTSAHYYIPRDQFNAALEVMDLGFANIFGLFQDATGSFEFDAAAKSVGNLRLAINATSLVANNADNQRDLAALLGVLRYPEIDFVAPDSVAFVDGKAEIKGTLTLHGVGKPVVLEATLNHIGKSPHGGGMWNSEGEAVGLSLRGNIKRADFGITDDPQLPGRFGDTITLMLETEAIRQ